MMRKPDRPLLRTDYPADLLPEEIVRKLARLEKHVRRMKVLRGIGVLATIAALGLALGLLIDLNWELSVAARIAVLAGVAAACGLALWLTVLRPWLRSYRPEELAAVVESAHPALHERLTSTIELSDAEIPEEHKGSPLMREWLARETTRTVIPLNFNRAVSTRRPLRAALAGAAAALVLFAPFVLWPDAYGLLWARFFNPSGNYDSPTNLYFEVHEGDRVVARSSDVTIAAVAKFRYHAAEMPGDVRLNWRDEAGESDSIRMVYDEETGAYATTVPAVMATFDFNVSSGRARSRDYRVTVVEAPAVIRATLDVEPPAYTGLQADRYDGAVGDIRVFERSRLKLAVTFNKPVAGARLQWLTVGPGGRGKAERAPEWRAPGLPSGPAPATQPQPDYKLVLSAEKRSAEMEALASVSGTFAIRLTDEYGLKNDDPVPRRLIVVPDAPPVLRLLADAGAQKARPDDVVPVAVEAADDIRLGALELHYQVLGGDAGRNDRDDRNPAERADSVIAVEKSLLGREVRHTFRLELAKLDLQPGSVVSYKVRAADERPVPGPNEVWSEPRVIAIDNSADPPGTEALVRRQERQKQSLAGIRKALEENREKVADLHKDAQSHLRSVRGADDDARGPADAFRRNDELPGLGDAQQHIADRLEKLAAEFGGNPILANLTRPVQQVAREQVDPAGRALKAAAKRSDAGLEGKVEDLNRNEGQIAAAIERLRELEDEFDKLARLERDLLELQRLAEDASRLAAKAADLEEQIKQQPDGESPAERRAREQRLEQQRQELARQHTRLSDALNDLLRRRPELIDAARRQELDRLAELSKKALELAEPQDLLAEALQKEAQDSAGSAQELAAEQQKLAEEAQRLADGARTGAAGETAAPLDPEALRQAIEELKKGNLAQAAAKQQKAADDLERFAEALHSREERKARAQEELEKLRKQQQELARNVKEQTETADPEVAGDGLQKLVKRQEDIARRLTELDVPEATAEQLDAVRESIAALSDLENRRVENANASQARTGEAIDRLQKRLADEPLADDSQQNPPQNSQQNDRQPAGQAPQVAERPQPGQAQTQQQSRQPGRASNAETIRQARQLAGQQRELARRLAARQRQRLQPADQQASGQPNQPNQPDQSDPSARPDQSPQQSQQELARDAARLALDTARQTGPKSPAAGSAMQFARRADQAARDLNAGQLQKASQSAQQAAEAGRQTAARLAEADDVPTARLQKQAEQLAERQARLADAFRQMADSPARRREAQQAGQQRLARQTDDLARQFGESAERLEQEPLNLPRQGQQAADSQGAARQAQQAMQQAGGRLAQGDAGRASQNARQAAEALRRAANQAQQAQAGKPASPVPGQVGGQVADAAQNLAQAGQQLARSQSPPTSQAAQLAQAGRPQQGGSPSQQASNSSGQSGQQPGQRGQSPNGSQAAQAGSQGQNGQSGQGGRGRSAISPSAAQILQQAAQALGRAAAQLQPPSGQAGAGNQQASMGQPGQPGSLPGANSGSGGRQQLDLTSLEQELQRLSSRQWGQLPGHLRTEILQAARRRPNADYARLIKLYFKEIAKEATRRNERVDKATE